VTAYLLPIAAREPLRWIVREQRTAFAAHRRREAEALLAGDRIFLYSTRGCFRNPTRDRGRVFGLAAVTHGARAGGAAVEFGGTAYPIAVALRIDALAPPRHGLELAPLVPRLRETFPDPATWSARMRRALVPLAEADANLIADLLAEHLRPYGDLREAYAA